MKLDGTLSSILASMYPESETPCFQFKPTKNFWNQQESNKALWYQKSIVTFCCKCVHVNVFTYEKQVFSILVIVIYRPR